MSVQVRVRGKHNATRGNTNLREAVLITKTNIGDGFEATLLGSDYVSVYSPNIL
jgi:hypothetical protein